MRKRITGAMLAATCLTGAAAGAVPPGFKEKADAILANAYAADEPGAVAVVYEAGAPVYAAGRGLAEVGTNKKIDAGTAMRLGSITKQFTAAAIMQLVDEGTVGLDDPLSKYLPKYPKPGADATVRQLLNHTSGIQSYTGIAGFMQERASKPHTTEQLIATFRDAPATFAHGSRWDYNNSGYILLGAILEQVTGKPWHQVVEDRITAPLGLTSIRYGGADGAESRMAVGYSRDGDSKLVPARAIHMSVPHAAGALIGTAGDVARWAEALHNGKVVKPDSYAKMIAPTKLPDGASQPYGFGLIPGTLRGRKIIGHDGGIFGFVTESIYLPSERLFVAVLANSDRPKTDPKLVSRRLAALALGEPFENFVARPLDLEAVAGSTGVYRARDVERTLYVREGKLFTRRKDGRPAEVLADGKGRFFYADALSWFEIARGADGKPVLQWHQDGDAAAQPMTWTGPVPAEAPTVVVARSELERLAGNYAGPLPIAVAVNGHGQLTLKFGDQPVTHLLPESATAFRVKEVEARVTFQTDGAKVTGLTIHQAGRDLAARRAD